MQIVIIWNAVEYIRKKEIDKTFCFILYFYTFYLYTFFLASARSYFPKNSIIDNYLEYLIPPKILIKIYLFDIFI